MTPRREEFQALARLALPIILTNLGTQLMGTVDTMMVGRLGDAKLLAAVLLANVWVYGTTMFAMGVVYGMDPIVTQAHGARDGERVGRALQSGTLVALAVSLVVGVLWTFSDRFLLAFDLDPQTARLAHGYTQAQIFSVPFFMVFVAMRQYLQGRGILAPTVWVIVLANLANVVFNWALIHGNLGFPAMGLKGAGIATGLTRVVMFGGLAAAFLWKGLLAGAWTRWSRSSFRLDGVLDILRYGIPTGIQMSLEIWAFGYAAILAGKLGDVPAAAHAVVLNMAALTFMVPMGLSSAAVTRVGNLLGEGRVDRARTTTWVAFAKGGGMGAIFAVIFIGTGTLIPSAYTDARDVLALCATILPIAAAFQIFDAIQVVGCGVLRGMGKTLPAAWFNLVGYWVLALPLGSRMAFEGGLGLRGVWWGLAIALALVAVSLLVYVRFRGPGQGNRVVSAAQRTS